MDLDTLREACRAYLAKRQELEDATARRDLIARELNDLTTVVLPEMFHEAHVDRVGLPAEGNRAAYDVRLKPFYRAGIAADWPDDRRSAGFAAMAELGLKDLIKYTITIRFAPGDLTINNVQEYLDFHGIEFETDLAVAWNTLSAALKDLCQHNKIPSDSQLAAIGGIIGHVVDVTRRDD